MNLRLWVRLLGIQLLMSALLMGSIGVTMYYSGYAELLHQWLTQEVWHIPIYSVLLSFIVSITLMYSGYLALMLSEPYERVRAKLNWLLLGKYHHAVFKEEVTGSRWYDNGANVSEDLNRVREKMLQLSTDLQEFAATPTFVGSETKEEIIEEERHRIARELHDSVSQQLFAATMLLSSINETLSDSVPNVTVKQLKMVEKVIATAQTEMRALLLHLRPIALEGKSLKDGIAQILQELQSKVAMNITWDVSETTLESGNEDHLFRIVQEAVSNTLRHSKATQMEVYLKQVGQQLHLKIVDNGVGFDMNEMKQMGSYGLLNIRERIMNMAGDCKILSMPNQGTVIDITIPVKERE